MIFPVEPGFGFIPMSDVTPYFKNDPSYVFLPTSKMANTQKTHKSFNMRTTSTEQELVVDKLKSGNGSRRGSFLFHCQAMPHKWD